MKNVNLEEIMLLVEKVLDDGDIDVKSLENSVGLDDQGVDSLDMMNIIFQIQDDYGVDISEESLEAGEWITIDKIVGSLNELLQKNP